MERFQTKVGACISRNNNISTNISTGKKSKKNKIDTKKNVVSRAEQNYDKLIKVSINQHCDSIRCKESRFNNFLQTKKEDKYCCFIKKISNLKNKEVSGKEIPFSIDEDMLNIRQRQRQILSQAGLMEYVEGKTVSKSTGLDNVDQILGCNTKANHDIRIYFLHDIQDRHIEIIFIDLYHLFATKKTDRYEEVSRYNIKMSDIVK